MNRTVSLLEYLQNHRGEVLVEVELGDDVAHNIGDFLVLTSDGIMEESFVRTDTWTGTQKKWFDPEPVPRCKFQKMVRKYDLDPDELEKIKVRLFGA